MRRFMTVAIAVLALASCKRTPQDEINRWNSNTAKIRELQSAYPGFKPALQARLDDAQKQWDAAGQVADEKDKVSRMGSVNSFVMGGFVGTLQRVDERMKSLRDKKSRAANMSVQEAARLGQEVIVKDAQSALDRVDGILKQGAATASDADTLLNRAGEELTAAENNLERFFKLQEPAPATVTKADDKKTEPTKTDTTPQPWKCPYCRAMSPADKMKCIKCGHAREK